VQELTDNSLRQRPVMQKILIRSWEYRHLRLWGSLRIGGGIIQTVCCFLILAFGGSDTKTYGWAAFFLVLAVLNFAFGYWQITIAYRQLAPFPQRVRDLEQSRARAVDDSATRLRRIEHDLHDGAQAQMVAVAMKLGLAREKLAGMIDGTEQANLERVLALVAGAHQGAKEAITELRDLARGIHPPVLDHGLDTALTTLAARSEVPVDLVVDLPERPSAAVETIAYFCAAELLANVTKHSGARCATLEVVHMPTLLRVRVSDDGTGGARIEPRGGLAGLAERVKTVDGTLQISSPPGGPTFIAIELPSYA
jgi:signal transduction histidine kinase